MRPACAAQSPQPAGKKARCGRCGTVHYSWYDRRQRRVRVLPAGAVRIYLELQVLPVICQRCQAVKRERPEALADKPVYTRRFAFYVGRRCRASTIKNVAEEPQLHWHTVKELDKQYMREQLRRIGTPGPKVIGIDELSVRKRHQYRIVVSDLERHRSIWFGGVDRSEASLDEFYRRLMTSSRRRRRS